MLVRIGLGFAGLVLLIAAYLLFWPIGFEPVVWTPKPNPGKTGVFAQNDRLAAATLHDLQGGHGPEDITVGPDGLIYTGLDDGYVVRLLQDDTVDRVVNTGGRPLGMQFDANDQLIVADSEKGLLSIDPYTGEITVLAASYDGKPMMFVDDLDIAEDGTIWFSDASMRYPREQFMMDFFDGKPTGRLFSYNPFTQVVTLHLEGLRFANGVAIGPKDSYVLVNETMGHRIRRLWLKGDRAGQDDMFVDGLPGYPDNLSFNGADKFWVALASPRTEETDGLWEAPFTRKVIVRAQNIFGDFDVIEPYGWVISVGTDGQVIDNLQDSSGAFHTVTSVNEIDGTLHVGSLVMPVLATLPAP